MIMGCLLLAAGCVRQRVSAPQTPEQMDAHARQYMAAMHQDLLMDQELSAELNLSVYYPPYDRSRTNYIGIRNGYWPQGNYFYTLPIKGDELKRLRQILAHMQPVPWVGRQQGASSQWPGPASGSLEDGWGYCDLILQGEHMRLMIAFDRAVVKQSQVARIMPLLGEHQTCYSLPDADYAAFKALPSIRKISELQRRYRKQPAPFFISREEYGSRRLVEQLHSGASRLGKASLELQMLYPASSAGEVGLLVPCVSTLYRAEIQLSEEELAKLRDILSRLEAVPMRYMVPFTAAPRDPATTRSMLHLELQVEHPKHESEGDGRIGLGDIGHSIIRRSERGQVARMEYGDCVNYCLPDADYEALMALPSIRKAMQWSSEYQAAPAKFFTKQAP